MALHVRLDIPPIPSVINALAEGLVLVNVELMKHAADNGVEVPSLYDSDVVYRREPVGREWWETAADILHVVADRSGDCEDLAGYQAAWYRVNYGEHATAEVYQNPSGTFHCIVVREDGTEEDVSRILLEMEHERTGVPVHDLAQRFTTDTRYS